MATNTTGPESAPARQTPMDSMRKAAMWAGALYLLTFVSIPTLALYAPGQGDGLHDRSWSGHRSPRRRDPGADGRPRLYRHRRRAHIRWSSGRTKRSRWASLEPESSKPPPFSSEWPACGRSSHCARPEPEQIRAAMGDAFVAFYDRAFLVGQSFIPAVNALLLGSLLYQSRLVPRFLPMLGFIGAATLVSYHAATLFGFNEGTAPVLALIAVLPIATWEFGLGIYLIVKGFRPSAVAALDTVPAVPGIPWPGRFASH